ncbi:Scr1 family TA system antitoxin-like transcriptional regulator, partial [Planobispora longispora]
MQVIPFTVGAYMPPDNPFIYLEVADPPIPDAIYLESLTGNEVLEAPIELVSCREAIDQIRAAV